MWLENVDTVWLFSHCFGLPYVLVVLVGLSWVGNATRQGKRSSKQAHEKWSLRGACAEEGSQSSTLLYVHSVHVDVANIFRFNFSVSQFRALLHTWVETDVPFSEEIFHDSIHSLLWSVSSFAWRRLMVPVDMERVFLRVCSNDIMGGNCYPKEIGCQ